MGGVVTAANYIGSFLIMHLFGFRLATKQPSLTASSLVRRLGQIRGHYQAVVRHLTSELPLIVRSQIIAAAGNFGLVVPATILFYECHRLWTGHPFLTVESANHVIASLNPFQTLTIPDAVLTGILLWFSSLVAGWVQAVALSYGTSIRSAKAIFGAASCIALGLLLAYVPLMGTSLGLPLDVRHFTLSTGSLTLALCSLGIKSLISSMFWMSLAGILFIGLCNFTVSFLCAWAWGSMTAGLPVRFLISYPNFVFRQDAL